MNCEHCHNPFRGLCACSGARAARAMATVGELRCVHPRMVGLVCASCGKSQRQIDVENGPGYLPPAPVCRWCHRTKGEHQPPSLLPRVRARMPCLDWQEHFAPLEASAPAPSAATPPSMGDVPPNIRITERQWDPAHVEAWMGVDFDGTLAHYTEWKGVGVLGDPIPAMVERVKAWLAEGRRVKLLTARHENPDCVLALKVWCKVHIGTVLEITGVKDRHMFELWDDRAVQVVSNTGRRADELTDHQRLAVLREIYAEMRGSGGSTVIALERYQDKVEARLR